MTRKTIKDITQHKEERKLLYLYRLSETLEKTSSLLLRDTERPYPWLPEDRVSPFLSAELRNTMVEHLLSIGKGGAFHKTLANSVQESRDGTVTSRVVYNKLRALTLDRETPFLGETELEKVNYFFNCLSFSRSPDMMEPRTMNDLEAVGDIPKVSKELIDRSFLIPKRKKGRYRLITAPTWDKKQGLQALNRSMTESFPQDERILAYRDGADYVKILKEGGLTQDRMLGIDLTDFYHQVNGKVLDQALCDSLVAERTQLFGADILEIPAAEAITRMITFIDEAIGDPWEYDSEKLKNMALNVQCMLLNSSATLLILEGFERLLQTQGHLLPQHTLREITNAGPGGNTTTGVPDPFEDAVLLPLGLAALHQAMTTSDLLVFQPLAAKELSHKQEAAMASFLWNRSSTPQGSPVPSKSISYYGTSARYILLFLFRRLKAFTAAAIPVGVTSVLQTPISSDTAWGLANDKLVEAGGACLTFEGTKPLRKVFPKGLPSVAKILHNLDTRANPVSWVTALPQGYPTSGIISNYVGLALLDKIEASLKTIPGVTRVKVTIFSDNLNIFYDFTDKNLPEMGRDYIAQQVKQACTTSIEKEGLPVNPEKFEDHSKDKPLLGVIMDENGELRSSRKIVRTLNQILLNVKRAPGVITYKGKAYSKEHMHSYYGLLRWFERTDNKNYSRKLFTPEFLEMEPLTPWA